MNRKERRASGMKNQKQAQIIGFLKTARGLSRSMRKAEADQYFIAALKADPKNRDALLDFSLHAMQFHDFTTARRTLGELTRLYPRDSAGLASLAAVEMEFGQRDAAFALAEKAMTCNPNAQVVTKVALLYRNDGMLDTARDYFYRAIEMDPNYVTPYYYLNDLKKYTAEDKDFAALKRLAQNPNLPPNQKMLAAFALGKAHLDTGDADSAFRHYAEGNKLRKDISPKYDMDIHEKYIDQIIAAFDESVVARLGNKVPALADAPQPVFIVGMPRSGSTLADQIIASHPDAVSLGEVPHVSRAMPVFPNPDLPASFIGKGPSISSEMLAKLTPEMLQDFAKKYLAQSMLETTGRKYIVDKMLQNFIWTGIMLLAFPEGKVLHTRRDPVDTGLSIWTLMFTDGTYWSYDQKDIARYHLACDKLMAHWKKVFPGRILDVVYEDMIADQEGQSRRMLAFCNIPWDDICLRFYETKRTVKTSSVEQVRRPIYTSSVKKWKKYEGYLGEMIEVLEAGGYRLQD